MDTSYHGATGREFDRNDSLDISFGVDLTPAAFHATEAAAEEDEIAVSVMVEGTTFVAVYGVVDGAVELISSDLGEGRAFLSGRPADQVARNLLRKMARDEMVRTEIPFMPDHHPATKKPAAKRAKNPTRGALQAAS